jgi:hypothetical protein
MSVQLAFDFTQAAHVDKLAIELRLEADGLSCDELATRLGRRRSDVLACLRSDPRFTRSGVTNGTRWRISEATGRNRSATGKAGKLPATPVLVLSQNGSQAVAA